MRKTKLSFDLFARQHGNDGYLRVSTGTQGPPSSCKKQVSKASIAKIVGVSLLLSRKVFENVSSLFANESEFVIIGMH
jgi:hypothetical protein